MNRLAVQLRPAANYRREQVAARHIEHDRRDQFGAEEDAYRNGILWIAVQKVRGTVEGIDDEREPFADERILRAELLSHQRRKRKFPHDDVGNACFCATVHFRDEISSAFLDPFDVTKCRRSVANERGRVASRFRRSREDGLEEWPIDEYLCLVCLQRVPLN